MKKWVFILFFLSFFSNANAQDESAVEISFDFGFTGLNGAENIGLLFNLEPRLKFTNNTAMGLRFGVTANSLAYRNADTLQFHINEISGNGVISIIPTFEYYFNEKDFHPFAGLGLGPYLLASFLDVTEYYTPENPTTLHEVHVKDQWGVLLRGGMQSQKIRLTFECNWVTAGDIILPNGKKAGSVQPSYYALSAGFAIRGK